VAVSPEQAAWAGRSTENCAVDPPEFNGRLVVGLVMVAVPSTVAADAGVAVARQSPTVPATARRADEARTPLMVFGRRFICNPLRLGLLIGLAGSSLCAEWNWVCWLGRAQHPGGGTEVLCASGDGADRRALAPGGRAQPAFTLILALPLLASHWVLAGNVAVMVTFPVADGRKLTVHDPDVSVQDGPP
jgi:hypothetical protein